MNILDQLEDLERKATRGVVSVDPDDRDGFVRLYVGSALSKTLIADTMRRSDANLIVAMRNALPALLRVARAAWVAENSVAGCPTNKSARTSIRNALAELTKEAT